MKRNISRVLIISLLMITGCNNIQNQKVITADTPYYSVTALDAIRDRNTYMILDAEIPKITYSNDDGSKLIDPINAEINAELTKLINEAKDRALNTYNSYLTSAKDNAKNDIENKLSDLKNKYKDIIGNDEINAISDAKNSIINRSFRKIGIYGNGFATYSDANWQPERGDFDFNYGRNPYFDIRPRQDRVNGFTNTENAFNPGLHNKNIIVVETTESKETNETTETNQRKGFGGRQKFASFSNAMPPEEQFNKTPNFTPIDAEAFESLNTEYRKKNNENNIENDIAITTATANEVIVEDLTIEGFNNELERLKRTRIPNEYLLTMHYTPTTITCKYEVKCLDEDYLSLFIEIIESRTTSMVKRLFYNIDLNNKKIVNIKDILGEKYKETCTNVINSAIEKWTDEQKAMLKENYSVENYLTETTPFFINNNHKPVIQIEKFAITKGSTGYHEFQIP